MLVKSTHTVRGQRIVFDQLNSNMILSAKTYWHGQPLRTQQPRLRDSHAPECPFLLRPHQTGNGTFLMKYTLDAPQNPAWRSVPVLACHLANSLSCLLLGSHGDRATNEICRRWECCMCPWKNKRGRTDVCTVTITRDTNSICISINLKQKDHPLKY